MRSAKRIAVIGGGAGGIVAAIAAAEAAERAGIDNLEVLLLEASSKVGRSILASGNGRCNFSNANIDASAYRNPGFVENTFSALDRWTKNEHLYDIDEVSRRVDGATFQKPPNAVVAFFAKHGLAWCEEAEGRLYPYANKSSSVLGVLNEALASRRVKVLCDTAVQRVEADGEGNVTLRFQDGEKLHAEAAILASGGADAPKLVGQGFGGIKWVEPRPILGPLATDTQNLKGLDGTRVRCRISLIRDGKAITHETGELLFRKYGVSGIAAFNLSRYAESGDMLQIDFLPGISETDAAEYLRGRAKALESTYGKRPSHEALLCGLLLDSVAQNLIRFSGLYPKDACTAEGVDRLSSSLKRFPLECRGIGDVRQCQVHRGGFGVDTIDPFTMQCANAPVYLIGEALDVDGPCGGYNLHWAFASGIAAGNSAIRAMLG